MDLIYELIANHGATVLTWVLAAVGSLLARYVWIKIGSERLREILGRTYSEIESAVLEDGKLTEEEKILAKRRAIETAKFNLGSKGIKRLARILGLGDIDSWLATKTEAAVASSKSVSSLPGGATKNPT